MGAALASPLGIRSLSASRASFQIAFQKGRRPEEAGAKLLGREHAASNARRIEGGLKMGKTSSPYTGKNLPLCGEREFAEKFSPVIEDMNIHRISRATGRSVETVKAWRARRAFPNGASLINAAREFPAIKAWLLEQIQGPDAITAYGDITELMQTLGRLSNGVGPTADMANAVLKEMHKPRGARE